MTAGDPILIDCDTGRDDALSLWMTLALGKKLAGVAASYGNVPLPAVITNTARVLHLAGADAIPLWRGPAAPSRPHRGFDGIVRPRQERAGNGLCDLELPAAARDTDPWDCAPWDAAALRSLSGAHGRIHYVVLGPATGLAALCNAMGPEIHDHISGVTMMGGKLDPLWSALPGADFNLVCDPFAVDTVLRSGLPLRFVTMNTTWDIHLGLPALRGLSCADHVSSWAKELMIAHATRFSPDPLFRFHDPCAVLAGDYPGSFAARHVSINTNENDADFGRLTVTEGQAPNAALFMETPSLQEDLRARILSALGLAEAATDALNAR